ncbi:hypothetical protein [Methylomonas sp. EFPC1]|uniref:hypothetical protein n=1 Tax=Methylomonas sp. EFPC1 TaxID=2812647 RepID=UPI001F077519|nr:hypothetical protein [Methylomonas sp. EFPC1]
MKQIALQQFQALGFSEGTQQMRGHALGAVERGIEVVFKGFGFHPRRAALAGIHALAIQIDHIGRQLVPRCDPAFTQAIWTFHQHAKTSSSFCDIVTNNTLIQVFSINFSQ